MSQPLTTRDRRDLDRAVPFSHIMSASSGGGHRFSDFLLPLLAVIDGLYVSAHAAALTADVTGGFVRDAAGLVVEVPPTTTSAFAVPGTGGQSATHLLSFDPVAKALVITAGTAAATGSQVAPSLPAGQIALATVTLANGDTATAQSKIDNATVRNIF